MKPTIIKVEVDSNSSLGSDLNKGIRRRGIVFLDFFKKLPNIIGNIIISFIILNLIKYLLDVYSINIMDPFYIKIFSIFGIIVLSIFSLNYLFKYLICLYFIKNKDLSISDKLPKLIYNYLVEIKLISEVNAPRFYLTYFIIYFSINILYIVLYFVI